MAEIKIEKKKGVPVWVILLLLLLLVLIVWAVLTLRGNDRQGTPQDVAAFEHRAFSREYEAGLRQRFDRNHAPAADRGFYAGDLIQRRALLRSPSQARPAVT